LEFLYANKFQPKPIRVFYEINKKQLDHWTVYLLLSVIFWTEKFIQKNSFFAIQAREVYVLKRTIIQFRTHFILNLSHSFWNVISYGINSVYKLIISRFWTDIYIDFDGCGNFRYILIVGVSCCNFCEQGKHSYSFVPCMYMLLLRAGWAQCILLDDFISHNFMWNQFSKYLAINVNLMKEELLWCTFYNRNVKTLQAFGWNCSVGTSFMPKPTKPCPSEATSTTKECTQTDLVCGPILVHSSTKYQFNNKIINCKQKIIYYATIQIK
jgi:hypothetical protein